MESESSVNNSVEPPNEVQPLQQFEDHIVEITPSVDLSEEAMEDAETSSEKKMECDLHPTNTEPSMETDSNNCDTSNGDDVKESDCETSSTTEKLIGTNDTMAAPIPPASSELLQINQDSSSSVQSVTPSRSHDPILKQGGLFSSISASNIIEYQWPADDTGEYYMIQEQISAYLGVTSFKRKYPDIDRHKLGPQELNHLMLKMLVSEVQVTLGLTAVRSRDVCDLMMKEYPEKFVAYLAAQDEKRKENIRGKHQQYSTPAVEKSQLPNYMKKAMKQVSAYNAKLNRRRRDDFSVYYDMQTNVLQFPKLKYKILHPDLTRPSVYPCSLIPGQFQEYCQKYTSDELGYFPLNTAIYGPPPPPPTEISELIQDSECSDVPESVADETMEVEAAENKAEKQPEEEEKVVNEEKEGEPNNSVCKDQETVQDDENSNSRDSMVTKDSNTAGKEDETASNSAAITEEELLQNYIDDPDKPMCGLCLRDETSNKKGEPEDLISCSQCDNYGHPSCLDMSKELVSVIVTYNWQCLECKTCTYCNKPHHEDKMMFCDRCDRGYHTFCVGLRNLPSGLWMCPQCTRSDPDFAKKGSGRRRGPRKRKLSNDSLSDEPPKPKRKRRTKKEMEEAREKERLEKEEKLKKMERKAEKKERRRRRKLRKEQKAAEAAASATQEQTSPKEVKEEASQDSDEAESKVQDETLSPVETNEGETPINDDVAPSKDDSAPIPNLHMDSGETDNHVIENEATESLAVDDESKTVVEVVQEPKEDSTTQGVSTIETT